MIIRFFQWLRPKRSMIINSDINRSIITSYQPTRRYQPVQTAGNSDDVIGKLAPTTSATTNYSDYRSDYTLQNEDD